MRHRLLLIVFLTFAAPADWQAAQALRAMLVHHVQQGDCAALFE